MRFVFGYFFFFVFALATSLCLFVAVMYVYICRSFLCSIVCCVCWPFPHTFCMKFFHRLRRQSESSVGLPKKRSIRLAVWRSQLTDNLPLPSNVAFFFPPELLKAIALEVARTHTYKRSINKRLVGLVLAGDAVTFVYSGAAMRQRSPYIFRAATSHTYTHAIDMSATPAQAIPFNHFKLLQIPINFLAIYDTRSIHRTFMCLL